MKFDINSYSKVIYVSKDGTDNLSSNDGSKEKPFLTIDFAKTQVTQDNTAIMIGEGEFLITSLNLLSLNYNVSYCGCGENTTILVSQCGGNFGSYITNFYKMIIKPVSSNFSGDTRFINYSDEANRVNYHNVAFITNGAYPTTSFICISSAAHIEKNKYFYNCSFIGNLQGVIANSYGHFINCATSTDKYFINGYDTDPTAISTAQLDTSVKNCEFNNYKLVSHDNKTYGVYSGDNAWTKTLFIIKENNKYYSIKPDKYVDGMYIELTQDELENNFEDLGFSINKLLSEITVREETFKPIDKFNKFKLVSNVELGGIGLKSLKSKKEMLVQKNDFIAKIQDSINFIDNIYTLKDNGNIKIAFSIDGGITWKTYDTEFKDLSIAIPSKPYSELTTDELTQWNNARDIISEQGISIDTLKTLDFNVLDITKIRFTLVISIDSINDISNIKNINWQYNEKPSYRVMKDSELNIEFVNGTVKVTPLIDSPEIKINVTNGESNKINIDNLSDDDIQKLKTRLGL